MLATDPRNEMALRLRAFSYMRLSRLAEARNDLNDLLKLKPDDAPLLALRGITAAGLKQFDQGMADVNRAISLDPNNAAAYLGRGMIKAAPERSRRLSLTTTARSASIRKIRWRLPSAVSAYVSLNQIDKALLDFDQALVLSQSNDLAKAWRGLALLLKGRSAEGLVDINGALDKNPNNQAAQLGRGLALLTSGQFDRAVVSFNQIVGKMADDTLARILRARALVALKKPGEAMSDLNFVLNVRPDFRGRAGVARHRLVCDARVRQGTG